MPRNHAREFPKTAEKLPIRCIYCGETERPDYPFIDVCDWLGRGVLAHEVCEFWEILYAGNLTLDRLPGYPVIWTRAEIPGQ